MGKKTGKRYTKEQIIRILSELKAGKTTTLWDNLRELGIDLITTIRRNMKPQIMPLEDRLLLRKRAVIESIHHIWKSVLHIDHTRHRSIDNVVVNLLAGLVAYCHRSNKPTVSLPGDEIRRLVPA